MERLQSICEKEGVQCKADALETLIEASDGDLRRAITYLQSTSSIKTDTAISVDDINDITGVRFLLQHIPVLYFLWYSMMIFIFHMFHPRFSFFQVAI